MNPRKMHISQFDKSLFVCFTISSVKLNVKLINLKVINVLKRLDLNDFKFELIDVEMLQARRKN